MVNMKQLRKPFPDEMALEARKVDHTEERLPTVLYTFCSYDRAMMGVDDSMKEVTCDVPYCYYCCDESSMISCDAMR